MSGENLEEIKSDLTVLKAKAFDIRRQNEILEQTFKVLIGEINNKEQKLADEEKRRNASQPEGS